MTIEIAQLFFVAFLVTVTAISFFLTKKSWKGSAISTFKGFHSSWAKAFLLAVVLLCAGSYLNMDAVAKQFVGWPYLSIRIFAGALSAVSLGMIIALVSKQLAWKAQSK